MSLATHRRAKQAGPLAPSEARALGLRPLTYPYTPAEVDMLARVLEDFAGSGRTARLVATGDESLEVWVRPIPAMAAMEGAQ